MASNGRSRRQAASTSLSPSPCASPSPPPAPHSSEASPLAEQRDAMRLLTSSATASALAASAPASMPPSPGSLQSAAGEASIRREKRQRRHGQHDNAEAAQTGRPPAAASAAQRLAGQQAGQEAGRQAERSPELKPEEAKEKEEKSMLQPQPSAKQTDGEADSKRRRRKRKEGESEEAVVTTPASAPLPSQQPASAPLFRPEDLQCVICLDLPAGRDLLQIFQCINGHLLCQPCFQKVVDSQRTVCPTCRVFLNRDRPIRCRFAETVLAALPTACGNADAGCRLHIPFGQLAEHQSSHCLHRTTHCKYHALGCDWTGLAKDVRRHARGCEVKSLGVKAILRGVKRRNDETERARQAERLQHRQASNVTAYLSKRARDIAIRDVTIEYDPITKERCANTFVACGKAWQLFLDPTALAPQTAASASASAAAPAAAATAPVSSSSSPSSSSPSSSSSAPSLASSSTVSPASSTRDGSVSLHINCISPLSRRLIVIFIVLPGPLLELPLLPTITKVTYTRHATESEQFRLRVDEAQARQLYALDSVNLRLAVIDCSRGKMKRGFGGVEEEDDSVSEESEEDSTAEEGGDSRRRVGAGGAAVAAAAATLMRAARSHLPGHDDFSVSELSEDDDYVDGEDDELDDDFMDDELHASDCDCDCEDDDEEDEVDDDRQDEQQAEDDEEAELAAAISGVSGSGLQQQSGRGSSGMEDEDISAYRAEYSRDTASARRRRL